MILIAKIQEEIVNPKTRLSTALEDCKLLAQQLQSSDFESWAEHELNGYPTAENLPDYRTLDCDSFGAYAGSFGRTADDFPIYTVGPTKQATKDIVDLANRLSLTQGVGQLEALIKESDKSLRFDWPAEISAAYTQNVSGAFADVQAWYDCPPHTIAKMFDTVRARLRDFMAALIEVDPKIVENQDSISASAIEAAARLFQRIIILRELSHNRSSEHVVDRSFL